MNIKRQIITFLLISSASILHAEQLNQDYQTTDCLEAPQSQSDPQLHQSDEDPFNPLDNNWWIDNVGYKAKEGYNIYDPQNLLEGRLVYSKAIGIPLPQKDSIIGRYIKSTLINFTNDPSLEVSEVEVFIQNCISETACRVYIKPDINIGGNLVVENTTFVRDEPASIVINGTALSGLSGTIRYNIINANDNGISFSGGLTNQSTIEYNWIIGPGRVIGTLHQDGIDIFMEGNTIIRRNKIEGFPNACIMIGSAIKPRQGTKPVENVVVTENYFLKRGLNHYYLYVREKDPNLEYQQRPRYITITNNWFEDKSITPISTGENPSKTAMFVRTEEERQEGIKRQEEFPAVLKFREDLGNCPTSVDARSWIVWNNNRWNDLQKTEIPPEGGKWYSLSYEQDAYASVTSVALDNTNASLTVGNFWLLHASISPANATNKAVTWTSSNAAVATVSAAGIITAIAPGTATITVKTTDGNKTATCNLLVSYPTGIDNVKEIEFNVYPSVVDDFVQVNIPAKSMIRIFDLSGILVKSVIAESDENRIPLSDLKPGMYIIGTTAGQAKIFKE